ncbi:MAG TPA: hypothetical protein PK733_03620, partial [Clostridiales bacterium]|nr:hypothetical protein [Clostridiales bacterium]
MPENWCPFFRKGVGTNIYQQPGPMSPPALPGMEQAYPLNMFPEQAMPEQVMPVQAMPGQAMQGNIWPGQMFPGQISPYMMQPCPNIYQSQSIHMHPYMGMAETYGMGNMGYLD